MLAAVLAAGAFRLGQAPRLGPFLEPAHGVWSLTRSAAMPADASASVQQLGSDVTVIYDKRAVPHIFARTEEDAYRALGYVVARDRLFQLFVQTLAATGRLTELAGKRALPLDREMRGLGLPRAAERAVAAQDTAGFMKFARAYSDGVNAYIQSMPPDALPLEFRLTGTKPEPWKPVNSYHLFNRMGYTLSYIQTENDVAAAASKVGADAAHALFPDASPIQEPIQPNGQHAPRFDFGKIPPPGAPDVNAALVVAAAKAFLPNRALAQHGDDDPSPSFASNNWAVSPKRSANGHALLEGDPHLELTLPSIWYEVHLVVPGKLDVYGVTIPGSPAVLIGFNRDVAWTFTNTGADVLDYYAEQVDDADRPTKYMLDGAWKPLERRVESYKDGAGREVGVDTVYFTHRGPMKRVNGHWLSMRWTVLEAGRELAGFYGAAHAASAADAENAMAQSYLAPAQNMLAADRGGHIAIRSTGRFPVRPADGRGNVIRDGTKSASDWTGALALADYPQAADPAQGYLASANQQPVDPRTTKNWWGGNYDPWRALRINALLRADSSMTTDKMQQFETDPGSERANLFVPYFIDAARLRIGDPASSVDTKALVEAATLLAAWDRRYTEENTRAALFEEAMRELVSRTWDELASADSVGRRVATPGSPILLELLADSANVWWDNKATQKVEHRDDILVASLTAALATLKRQYGDPMGDGWRWSRIRHANINHLLRLPALSALSLPVQGGPGTLSPSSGTGTQGPSWRMVVDLGPEISAWSTYPGGQSGNPLSKRYKDRIKLWTSRVLEPVFLPHAASDLPADARTATLTLHSAH